MAVFTGNGSNTAPSITFSSDTNTGIYRPAADTVAVTTDGAERLRVDSAGEVTTANEKLNLITVGRGAGAISTNTAVGTNALRSNTTGCNNTASGRNALCSNTTGCNNTASGLNALRDNTTGSCNTASGFNALFSNTTGGFNTAFGDLALRSNTTGGCNTAFGRDALLSNTTGDCNTASGINALETNTTGSNNTAFGNLALFSNTTGCNNIGVGVNAGRTGGSPGGIVDLTTESNHIVMGNNAHTCALIKIAWTVTSDCRDKTCFAPVPHGLDFVRALKPTEYRFKEGGRDSEIAEEKRRYGFLAQDILPLEGEEPVIISADDPDKLQYTEAHLIPVLVKAIQELAQEVNELKNA
jgi:trimeric autotransporter adhesin